MEIGRRRMKLNIFVLLYLLPFVYGMDQMMEYSHIHERNDPGCPTLSLAVSPYTCVQGGSITVTGDLNGYSISWSGPSSYTSTQQDITSLDPGLYVLTISGPFQCTYNETVLNNCITSSDLTTNSLTTVNPTTSALTTSFLTTQNPTTKPLTTQNPTTKPLTTQNPTTSALSTQNPTTSALSTQNPTTSALSTQNPTTKPLTTQSQTTQNPTTASLTTQSPTTRPLTTQSPTTSEITSDVGLTSSEITSNEYTSQDLTTSALSTQNPTTSALSTQNPTTSALSTQTPTTKALSTQNPTTAGLTTAAMSTQNPTTKPLTTSALTTADPTTSPLTTKPLTSASLTTQPLTTQSPTTQALTTQSLTTKPLTSASLTTQALTTKPLTTQALTTKPLTTSPLTTSPVTSSPLTTSPLTTSPWTTNAVTSSPLTTNELTTNELTTNELTTNELTTNELTTNELTTNEITSNGLTTNALTTSKLTTKALTTSRITSSAMTTNFLTTNALTTMRIEERKSKDNRVAMVGGIVGALAGVTIIGAVVVLLLFRKRYQQEREETSFSDRKGKPSTSTLNLMTEAPSSNNVELTVITEESYESVKSVGVSSEQNPAYRRTMEDEHVFIDKFGDDPKQAYIAVYDGHGGRDVAEYLAKKLHKNILKEFKVCSELNESAENAKHSTVSKALQEAYMKTDKKLFDNEQKTKAGSTAVTAILTENKGKKMLYVANVGDARAVLSRDKKASRLSFDHKANEDSEIKRIKDGNGWVIQSKVAGILSVTRAFGDPELKQWVNADPYITETEIQSTDKILIVACDGLWDVCTDQEAVDAIQKYKNGQEMSNALLNLAMERKTRDNITILVVIL